MALPLPPGLVPSEVAFLCEMELVTVVPRQRLESIELLSGVTPTLRPPHRNDLPLWLAILLKKQRRANIVPPPWLHPDSLRYVIHYETTLDIKGWAPPPPPPARADSRGNARRLNFPGSDDIILSPPFLPSCTSTAPTGALPYHWFELAEMLLAHAGDDIPSASEVRSLLRDLQEARAAKMRSRTARLDQKEAEAADKREQEEAEADNTSSRSAQQRAVQRGRTEEEDYSGGIMSLRGVGAMELAESRGFVTGVVEGVRKIGASAEASRREAEKDSGQDTYDDDSDEDMGL